MSEILVRKQEVRPGETERLHEWVDETYDEAEGDGAGVREVWAEESLRTVSLFVEHAEDADYFVWYIEAESMERPIEAREASTHPLHELEDAMMAEVSVDPAEAGDFEPLLHGVSPERPDEFAVERYADGPQ